MVMESYNQLEIRQLLNQWYENNKRDLPWRETNDPYKIWISEIILQQTRVVQGLNYYLRFIDRFPTIKSLAESTEEDVLKEWQGLGYYNRARNLHSAAQRVMSDYNGMLPETYKELLSLKGIGEYTGAAILSTAFNKPHAVVDGNVYRVLSRLFAIDTPIDTSFGKKQFAQLAQDLLDEFNPGTHNQALMEFGALNCTPMQPLCDTCPLNHICLAKESNSQHHFPVKQNKQKIRKRYFHYFFVNCFEYTYLNKRQDKDIWKNMYEFPLIETDEETSFSELIVTNSFLALFNHAEATFHVHQKQVKHILTHQHIYANFYEVTANKLNTSFNRNFLKIKIIDIDMYPISRLIHRYLEQTLLIK